MFSKVSTLLLFLSGVLGHGYLQFPSSRNFEQFQQGKDYNFMGLNGGGASYVNKNLSTEFTSIQIQLKMGIRGMECAVILWDSMNIITRM